MMGIGIISLLGKLHKWDEGAIWFDGSSLGMSEHRGSIEALADRLPHSRVRACHCGLLDCHYPRFEGGGQSR